MKRIIFAISAIVLFNTYIKAQVSITSGAGLTYTQDFNTLDPAAVAPGSSVLPNGWSIFETGGASANNLYVSNDGATNTGNTYSYGTTSATDRALGSLSSGSLRSTYGVKFTNNTGATITSASITYRGEQWRSGDASTAVPDTLYFSYSYIASAIDTAVTGWIDESNLNFVSPQPLATNGAVDGNLAGNYTTVTYNLTGISIPNGTSFSMRWLDRNMAGNDDGLAVDDLSIVFATTSGPTAPILVSSSPADNASGVAATVNTLSMTFNQAVTAGSGYVYLYNTTASTVDSFAVSGLNYSGNTVTANGISLAINNSYAVQIPSTAFQTAGLYYAGISNFTTWNFNTNVILTPYKDTLYPADNSTNVALTTVPYIVFDKTIAAGSGVVKIVNITDGTTQTLTVPGTDVVVTGMKATFNNVTLLNGKNYAIMYDSTCFVNASNTTVNCLGSYDSVFWNFSTVPGIQPPVTSLNEAFTGCLSPNYGKFSQYSAVGAQTWKCSKFGHNDTNAVYINGYAGGNLDNEDWLISPAIDVSAMANPYLHFWSKLRFAANTTKQVLVSTNYTGVGDPNSATWSNLNISLAGIDTSYKWFKNTSINAIKAAPFYLAFKYVSTTSDADEWSIDDIQITDGMTALNSLQNFEGSLFVLGTPINSLNLQVENKNSGSYNFVVRDITGNILCNNTYHLNAGKNYLNFDISTLSKGMYTVSLYYNNQKSIVKFIK